MRGTLLNTASVAAGACIGLAVGARIPSSYQEIVVSGLGIVTAGMGIRLFLQAKSVVLVASAIALGGILGVALGIDHGLTVFAEWARLHMGGEAGRFNEALITTSVLYCVGPMTLLGCLQDGVEGNIELLAVKSTMDGITAVFFAAALGPGVLVTAAIVLAFQGAITLAARPLRRLLADEHLIVESAGAGGVMLVGIGLGLLQVKHLPVANYLPALLIAPGIMLMDRWRTGLKGRGVAS